MLQTVLKNEKGLTLVEVLIALVLMLLVSLALMQTALLSIESNMTNALRDEAVNVAEEQMNEAKNTSFASLLVGASSETVLKDIRNKSDFPYSVDTRVSDINTDNKKVEIDVTWNWKNTPYTHSISTIVRNND